ncbi:MAG: hypothetical protein OXC30_01410 [Alphaproteobacteria bacterium]|nr:hypothetical protein [Alphaproteobacteria bacterium]
MALVLLFLMFASAHGATGGGTEDELHAQVLTQVRQIAERLKQSRLMNNRAQAAIEPYRQKILDRLDDGSYLKITVLRELVDFVEPIIAMLYDSLSVTQWPAEMLEMSRVCEKNGRVDTPLFHQAFLFLKIYLPANQEGPLWITTEKELAKDPRNLNVFTSAFKNLIGSLHLYCQQKPESAQKMYNVFSDLLSANTFWQLAQKSIDPYRLNMLDLLSHSSIDSADQFIRCTTPIVEILKKASKHSHDYLSADFFQPYRLQTLKSHYLDPTLFLQALDCLRICASYAKGGWVAMAYESEYVSNTQQRDKALLLDTEHMKQAMRQAGRLFLAALMDFCYDDWASAAKSFDAFLKVDLKRKYI